MISRNALISIFVLLAGLIAGYFTFRLTASLPVFALQEVRSSGWPGSSVSSDTAASHFHGSSVELSRLYHESKPEFQEVVDGGDRSLRELSIQKDLLLTYKDTATLPGEDLDRQIRELEQSMDLHRLLDYYTHYFMHFYRWIDTGDAASSVSYRLAMGQFWATVTYHQEKYIENPNPIGINLEELLTGTRVAGQTDRAIRWARVLTVILLFVLVMGIPRFIRDQAFRKFAASLYFDALFRPYKISGLNAWHSLSRLAPAMVLIYLFGGVIMTSFSSYLLPVILGSLGLLPVVSLILVIRNRRKSTEILVSLMAPKIFLMLAVLSVMAVRGPMFFWYHIWVSELFRAIFLSVFMMLVFHRFHVHVVLARKWSHRNRRAATAMIGMASGLQWMVFGLLLLGFGSEFSLQALNSDLILLPVSGPAHQNLSGLLALSPNCPVWVVGMAGIVLIVSLLVLLFNRKSLIPSSRQA